MRVPGRPFFMSVGTSTTSSAPSRRRRSATPASSSPSMSSTSVLSCTSCSVWTPPLARAPSATTSRSALGRPTGSLVPAPNPLRRGTYSAGGGPDESTRTSAAPVGVTSSPAPSGPGRTGCPSRSLSVAGAGTGSRPCAARTEPSPSAIGPQWMRSIPSSWNPHTAPTTSRIASTAPTSCRCTSLAGMPWISPSASAIATNAASARCRTLAGTAARATSSRISPIPRPCGCGGISKSTFVHTISERRTRWMRTSTPSRPSRPGSARSHSAASPTSRSAPSVMSPEIPLKGSRMPIGIACKATDSPGGAGSGARRRGSAITAPRARVEDDDLLVARDPPRGHERAAHRERAPALGGGVDPGGV